MLTFDFLAVILLGCAILAALLVGFVVGIYLTRMFSNNGRTKSSPTERDILSTADQNEGSAEIVSVTDSGGNIVYQTPHVAKLLGFEPGHWLDKDISEMVRTEDLERLHEAQESLQDPGRVKSLPLELRKRDGSFHPTETSMLSIHNGETISGFIYTSRESSRWRLHRDEREMVGRESDDLTGLPTRAALRQYATQSLRGALASHVAVVTVDIDGFGGLNDLLGHARGDDILKQVTLIINRCIRPWDVVSRIGADEFAILIVGANAERSVGRVYDRLQRSLAGVVVGDGREIRLTVSMGYAVNTLGTESAEELLRNSEVALSRARSAVRIDIVRFEPTMHDAIVERLQAEQELREALSDNQLDLMYQPLIRLSDYRVVGAEALVRWNHPKRGLLTAGAFVPLAEEMGVIHELGGWALRKACHDALTMQQVSSDPEFKISVNVSGKEIESGLVVSVQNAIRNAGLAPESLVLEVTESVLAERPDEAAKVLQRIRAIGCRIALDDFGTGYSSLAYLAKFPVDILKIDRSFIQSLSGSHEQLTLARTIVSLGQALQLDVVAEGVESSAHADLLRGMGCETAQGFVFSPPVSREALTRMLTDQQKGQVKFAGVDAIAEVIVDQARFPESS